MTGLQVRELGFAGVLEIRPPVHRDQRGEFVEAFVGHKLLAATGLDFPVAQANLSVSVRGTVRGIHFSAGQAKYVQCASGRVLDVIVDLRPSSASFGDWVSVELDSELRNAVHIPAGFGHGFQALTETATVFYLCSSPYDPALEGGIDPLDPDVAISWPIAEWTLSDRDTSAQSLAEYRRSLA